MMMSFLALKNLHVKVIERAKLTTAPRDAALCKIYLLFFVLFKKRNKEEKEEAAKDCG
jgi:hypothetical protein